MFCEKKYAFIIDHPNLISLNLNILINYIINNGLIPIIVITDSKKYSSQLNYLNKIDIFINKNPKLKDDNFIIMNNEYKPNDINQEWFLELSRKVNNINDRIFGLTDTNVNSKMFIINNNNFFNFDNNFIIPDKYKQILSNLFNILDILNVTNTYNKILNKKLMFRYRDNKSIYYDDINSTIFYSKLKSFNSNQSRIIFLEENYVNLIKKYNLGNILFSEFKKAISIDNEELDNIIKMLNSIGVKYKIDSNQTITNKNLNQITIHIGN